MNRESFMGKTFSVIGQNFVTASSSMLAVLERVERVASFDVAVHIRGESGTGKELIARAIHDQSVRTCDKFVALNCAALPDTLLESELFGHTRGAFTGADRARTGLVEEADGGTLFLDEIADLSPRGQTLLLRVIQDKEYRPLGERATRRSEFRLISATHKILEDEVVAGRFREDLLFRLKVVDLELPPLRERREDILPLVNHVMKSKGRHMGIRPPSVQPEVEQALLAYNWPGNVRELENEIVQALCGLGQGRKLTLEHLTSKIRGQEVSPLRCASLDFERRYLRTVLTRHGGNRTRAARELGLTRQGLYKKLRKHGLNGWRVSKGLAVEAPALTRGAV
jgi:transcriptional regulator with PAS, ATPase and Fis domain